MRKVFVSLKDFRNLDLCRISIKCKFETCDVVVIEVSLTYIQELDMENVREHLMNTKKRDPMVKTNGKRYVYQNFPKLR